MKYFSPWTVKQGKHQLVFLAQGEAKLAKNMPESLCKFGFCNTIEILSDVKDHIEFSRMFSRQLRRKKSNRK